jgi:hypothetical protein
MGNLRTIRSVLSKVGLCVNVLDSLLCIHSNKTGNEFDNECVSFEM